MSTIRINSKTFTGRSVTINNNQVYIDGELQPQDEVNRNISIIVEGDVENLSVDICDRLEIKGSVKGPIQTTSGDVNCGNVAGSVSMMSGDVMCDDIGLGVRTMSGDIKCKSHK